MDWQKRRIKCLSESCRWASEKAPWSGAHVAHQFTYAGKIRMDISGQQKTRWNCLPHQQQEALKFTWDHINGGPIQWRAGLLYRSSGQEPYRSLKNVSKRTLRALVRHNCIRIEGYDDDARGALPPENEPWTLHLTDLGCVWGRKKHE